MKDRKAAYGLGKGSVSSKGIGDRRFGREGLQVTECCVDAQSTPQCRVGEMVRNVTVGLVTFALYVAT